MQGGRASNAQRTKPAALQPGATGERERHDGAPRGLWDLIAQPRQRLGDPGGRVRLRAPRGATAGRSGPGAEPGGGAVEPAGPRAGVPLARRRGAGGAPAGRPPRRRRRLLPDPQAAARIGQRTPVGANQDVGGRVPRSPSLWPSEWRTMTLQVAAWLCENRFLSAGGAAPPMRAERPSGAQGRDFRGSQAGTGHRVLSPRNAATIQRPGTSMSSLL